MSICINNKLFYVVFWPVRSPFLKESYELGQKIFWLQVQTYFCFHCLINM